MTEAKVLDPKPTQLPVNEKKLPLTPEEKLMLKRRDLTIQEKEALLSKELTKEEQDILARPPSSLTQRNKNRRLRMVFPDAKWDDPEFDPTTLPPVYDYQFVNKAGIEVCIPGTDEFTAQKLLNRFMSEPEIVAVESSDGPMTGDPNAPEGEVLAETGTATRSPSAKGFGEKSHPLTDKKN